MLYIASILDKITFPQIFSFIKSLEYYFPFIIFCLLILIIGYIIRVKQIKSIKRKLAFLVEKRTKTISKQKDQIAKQNRLVRLERDKSDKLLSNVLPQNIVQELKIKGQVEIKSYKNVSVIFIDIVGFTKIAERNNPTYLVNKLNDLFSEFDSISEKNNLEKIKTIGDAYLAVGGFGDHPELSSINCVSAALEIQLLMNKLKDIAESKNEEFWEVRIGIHNGDVIAGVLGTKRIAYDIFGNTVNIAKRIESNSVPGKVNISESTYKVVKTFFDCSSRGKIATKNTGEIYMFYVNGVDSAFSSNEAYSFSNWFKEYKVFSVKSKIDIYGLEEYGLGFLTKKLAKNLYYHGTHHTKDVLNAVEKIAFNEKVSPEEFILLRAAALFHDFGYIDKYLDNEKIGVDYAREILPNYGFNTFQVNKVCDLVMATRVPQKPNNHLERIICDADLDYLGREDFISISSDFYKELKEYRMVKNKNDWDQIQIKFLKSHHFFTEYSINNRSSLKKKNLEFIKDRVVLK
tara:strand:+ start:2791 stop:4341 length:1551 start_codon:yes stop_codon:yes gene_type:complete